MNKKENDLLHLEILKAAWIKDYLIEINFNNGKSHLVDFEDFLKKSNHPDIRKYLDIEAFKKFEIKDGNLDWNDFDLIFPIADLYSGRI